MVPRRFRGAAVVLLTDGIRIPTGLVDLAAFRRWSHSGDFPEKGRIDWLGGELEVDMSPEELNSHGSPKSAVTRALHAAIEDSDRGVVYVDSTRISSNVANLSAEPDVVVVLFESVDSGKVHLVEKARAAAGGRFVEIEGSPDLVVECVSDSSVSKDCHKLRERYFLAGIPEYWIIDARGPSARLTLLRRSEGQYSEVSPDPDGFALSTCLRANVRLVGLPRKSGLARYRLDISRPVAP